MPESADECANLQIVIERFAGGDDSALNDLLLQAANRLEKLAHSMFSDFTRVRRWEETADIVQNASVRLFRAFQTTRPTDVRGFFALAALQIRRELVDLARHYFGPEGLGANYESRSDFPGGANSSDTLAQEDSGTFDPSRLSAWSEFHEHAGELPNEEREVFDLIYYQGLEQIVAAELIGISERTVRRRWQSAKETLNAALDGRSPV